MGTDDDIALSLPEPPPPRPARREAAIEEALRRFDGADAPPRAATGRPRPWLTGMGRPQIGMLVSAALIAVIGVPVVLTSINQRFTPAPQDMPARTVDRPATPGSVARAPAARPSPPILAEAPPSPNVRAGEEPVPVAPPTALADSAASPAPAMKMTHSDAPPPPPPPPPTAPTMQAEQAEQGFAAGIGREAQLADARGRSSPAEPMPAQAPMVAARKARSTDATDIVVTGSATRLPARRGDWNACTVNDPNRDLSGCRRLVDPGAKGPAGRAAARLADGLSLAWQGDYDGAITAFDQAIELQPRLSFAYLNRGLTYQRRGEIDRAIADLDRAVRYAPNAARGYYNRSLLLRQRGDTRRASADEGRAIDLDARYDAVVK